MSYLIKLAARIVLLTVLVICMLAMFASAVYFVSSGALFLALFVFVLFVISVINAAGA